MAAAPVPAPVERGGLVRGLGLLDATTLIVGSVIGSGIFVAPSIMAGYIQTPGLLLGLWVLGGVLTLFGALAYAEMAAALPRAGGQYVFLKEAFTPLWGFLYGWTFLLAINTGFIAAVSVAFAKYLGVFLPAIGEGTVIFAVGPFPFTTAQAVGLVVIAALTWINITGLRTGALVQNVFTIAKVAAIAVLVVLALASGRGSPENLAPVTGLALGPEGLKVGLFAALGVAMSKALFAYDAWNSVTFAAEEMRHPEKNLPRALVLGSLGIMVVYCAAVAVYLYMVPVQEMYAVRDNRIAAEAAQRMIGPAGAGFIAVAILVSTFGCINGLILAGARVLYAMARDGLFFRQAAEVHEVYRTPAHALVLQGAVAAVLTLTGTYSDLLTLTAFASLLFNTLTVAALFVLRHRRPHLARPYRAWGYPVLPAIYILVSGFFLWNILLGDPRNSGMGLALAALGLPAYTYWSRHRT
ncbi:MAG TPA: amino acid permease [Vicinamibacteria bacterium]|nr:amino acid permease [Vicinamibacteria bacterium]